MMNNYNKILNSFMFHMRNELRDNEYKGNFLNWKNIRDQMIELEFHKAKLLTLFNEHLIGGLPKDKAREYIADCANILMAMGNTLGLYDEEERPRTFSAEEIEILLNGDQGIKNPTKEVNLRDYMKKVIKRDKNNKL